MKIEIDFRPTTKLLFGNSEPVTDRDSGQPVRDKDTGFPVYRVNLMAEGVDGRPDRLTVKVPGEPKNLAFGQPVRLEGVVMSTWTMGDRAGVSFNAAVLAPATGSAPSSSKAAAA